MKPDPSRPRFSAVVVARNEELNIRRCLEHLAWCHERIVVDMTSEDRTRELAAPLATAILPQAWIPHMEFARNHGIDAATGEWVLIVDADELIPEKLVRRLEEHVAASPATAGVWIPRMNYFFGLPVPHTGGFPDYQLRLFRRGTGRYPDRLRVEGCDIGFSTSRGGTRSVVEGIDGVGVNGWVVRASRFVNVTHPGSVAYGVFTKGNSSDTIIESCRFEIAFLRNSIGACSPI